MGIVYVIGNTKTKRFYVGKTDRPLIHRENEHFRALIHHRHKVEQMQIDYDKYGIESFFARELGTFEGSELMRMESFMMSVLRTKDIRYGYNYKDVMACKGKYSALHRRNMEA